MKNFKKIATQGLILITLTLLNACNGTSSGNPPKTATTLGVTASDQTLVTAYEKIFNWLFPVAWAFPITGAKDLTNLDVILDSAWIALTEIEFKVDDSVTEEDDSRLKGTFAVDLLSNNPTLLNNLEISETIDEIKWKLEKVEDLPLGAPAELQDQSMIISGTVDGNQFTFISDDDVEMEYKANGNFQIKENSNIVVNFYLKEMLSKINLSSIQDGDEISKSSLQPALNPCPDIDLSANNIYTCFRKGLESESRFGKDSDDDFEVDDD